MAEMLFMEIIPMNMLKVWLYVKYVILKVNLLSHSSSNFGILFVKNEILRDCVKFNE